LNEQLEALLASGVDAPTLRYTLAKHYLDAGEADKAVAHAEVAVELDADYSAGWRLLGQAQAAAGRPGDAARSFERGIEVASRSGDRQVEKEMQVFLKRLRNR